MRAGQHFGNRLVDIMFPAPSLMLNQLREDGRVFRPFRMSGVL